MNNLTIIGNLVRNPELRTTPQGKKVCSIDVAVNRRRQVEGQPEADYFRVNCWNALAESCAKYLSKGKKVAVTGSVSLSKREHDGKFYASLEVFAEEVEFLSPKDSHDEPKTDAATVGGFTAVETDELPFD